MYLPLSEIDVENGKYYALWDNGIDDRPHSRHIYSNTHTHTHDSAIVPRAFF